MKEKNPHAKSIFVLKRKIWAQTIIWNNKMDYTRRVEGI